MANNSASVLDLLGLIGRAVKAIATRSVKRVMKPTIDIPSSSNALKKRVQDSDYRNPEHENAMFDALRAEIDDLRKRNRRLESEQKLLKERCDELFKRMDSITQEYLDDIEALKKNVEKELANYNKRESHTPELADTHHEDIDSANVYVEPTVSGDVLLNAVKEPNNYGNFIELNTRTGNFQMVLTSEIIDYVLNNRDYVLGACEVSFKSVHPTSIRVDAPGYVEKSSASGEWNVVRKMKVTIY